MKCTGPQGNWISKFFSCSGLEGVHESCWKDSHHLPKVSQLHQFLLFWEENQNNINTSQISPLIYMYM